MSLIASTTDGESASKESGAFSPERISAERGGKISPMMAQYIEIKAANPDLLLFYRMGDFYELFFEDAEVAAARARHRLTKRGKHCGDDIPMCGVPVERAEEYLHRLIALAIASPSANRSRTRRRRESAAASRWCGARSPAS